MKTDSSIFEKVLSSGVVEPRTQPHYKRGEGRTWRRGRIYWIQYYDDGRQIRESSRSPNRDAAERLLRQRIAEADAGLLSPPRAKRVRYEELRDALLADYQTNHRKWLRMGRDDKPYISGISHLDDHFSGSRAVSITTDRTRSYIRKRQEDGASNGTINRELALLRRMIRLAAADGKLRDVPHFPMLKEAPPRKGFLEDADFQRVREQLPKYLRPVLTMAYYTGMREGEILGLRWDNVNLLEAQVRLDPGSTKNDEPRTVPLVSELLESLKVQRQKSHECEFVFTHDGERIGSFNKAWKSACKRAGLSGLLFHDLRRTGVRNLVRAGVPERVAMAISGHKTRAVFERYNIVSERDLAEAASKLELYLAENRDKTGTIASASTEAKPAASHIN